MFELPFILNTWALLTSNNELSVSSVGRIKDDNRDIWAFIICPLIGVGLNCIITEM